MFRAEKLIRFQHCDPVGSIRNTSSCSRNSRRTVVHASVKGIKAAPIPEGLRERIKRFMLPDPKH